MAEELYPFQLEAAEKLTKMKVALLAYEMGMGKTPICIHAAKRIKAKNVLVICPVVAQINWQREWERFGDSFINLDIIPYSQVQKERRIPNDWDLAILDECHYLKSVEARRTRAVLGKTGLLRRVKGPIWALSGTPAPNNASELWPLLFTFGVTKLSFDAWCSTFCEQRVFQTNRGTVARQITGTKISAIPHLKAILAPVMLRKRKEEVLDLPPIVFEDVMVAAGEVDLEVSVPFVKYVFPKDARHDLFDKLEKEARILRSCIEQIRHPDQLRTLEAVSNSISTLRMYSGCQKIQPVADLVSEELEANAYEKIVIFALHVDVIEGLRQKLLKFKPVTLYGGTEARHRQRNIDKFQNNPRCRVFIGNIHAAGTAITLTRAHHVLFAELSFTPGDNAQAMMRCHRIGQTKKVHVRFISLDNPIDEKVTEIIRRKTKELALIFDEKHGPSEAEREFQNKERLERNEQLRRFRHLLS